MWFKLKDKDIFYNENIIYSTFKENDKWFINFCGGKEEIEDIIYDNPLI